MTIDDPVPIGDPLPHPAEYQVSVPPEPPLALKVTGSPEQAVLGMAFARIGCEGACVGVIVTDAQNELPQMPSLRA